MAGFNQRIVKAKLSLTDAPTCELVEETSVILRDEIVLNIHEYSANNLLITCIDNQNVIKCEGLKKFTDIVGPKQANGTIYSIQLLPQFDENDFPFFIVTGKAQIWLGNLNRCKAETLVEGSSQPYFDQPGVLFLDQRKGQFDKKSQRFLFDSDFLNKSNKQQYQIHEMTLYSDFMDTLKRIGHLPEVTVANVVAQEEEIIAQKNEIAELKAQLKKIGELSAQQK